MVQDSSVVDAPRVRQDASLIVRDAVVVDAVVMDASFDGPSDAQDASCDPGVPGVKCLAKAPPGSQILSLVVDDTKVYFAESFFPDSGPPFTQPLMAASRVTGRSSFWPPRSRPRPLPF